MRPGEMISPVQSISSTCPGDCFAEGSTIFPSTIRRSPVSSRPLAGSMIRPFRKSVRFIADRASVSLRRSRAGAEVEYGHSDGETVGYLFQDDRASRVGDVAIDF